MSLGQPEGVSHGAANQNRIRFLQQPVDDFDFVRDLGSAQNHDKGSSRLFQFIAEEFEFAFHEQSRGTFTSAPGDNPCDSFSGSMGAMGGAERIIDIDIGYLR